MNTTKTITLNAQDVDMPGVIEGHSTSATILTMNTKHDGKVDLKVSYINAAGCGRHESNGPILPGPFAATFPLGVVISNPPQAKRETVEVQDGDILEMDGKRWVIRDNVARDYPHLYPIN
jgi:hypothetical protein